jgi:hypothetical protein
MIMRKSLTILLILMAIVPGINAQEKFIEKFSFSTWFGARFITCDSFPDGNNLDFLNYLYDANGGKISPDYGYFGMASHLWLRGNWELDLKFSMYDDFTPNQINISTQYFPLKYLGFNLGIYGYSQLMNEYNQYHHHTDTGFYGDIDPNYRQRSIYDIGIIAGPVIAHQWKRFSGCLKINAGLGTFLSFTESISQKKTDANFRREYKYTTKATPAFFFFPELAVGYDLFRCSGSTLGIQLQASYYLAKRSIDYTRNTLNWTTEITAEEEVVSPEHHYSKFDVDVGIYLRFPADPQD